MTKVACPNQQGAVMLVSTVLVTPPNQMMSLVMQEAIVKQTPLLLNPAQQVINICSGTGMIRHFLPVSWHIGLTVFYFNYI